MKKVLIFNILMALIWIGCTSLGVSRKKVLEDEKPEDSTVQSARYEPTSPVQLTFLDTLNKGNEITLDNNDFHKEESVPGAGVVLSQTEAAVRYKIQLFASSQIETVRELKRQVETKVNLPLSISFESPYYKLLAGSFLQRTEAENQLKKIKSLGYTDAWIVSTKTASN
ncbi:MAG: SPOR domain-containing protein [Fibrobacter sp.]|jgi:hypothetical protein|nr:SPOR domain-containing protein [Fibrobacter sp.]